MIRLAWIDGSRRRAGEYARAAAHFGHAGITAVVHSDESTRREVARLFGVSQTASSCDELLKTHAAEFDAVLVHTPLDHRAATARRAATAGKHVFLAAPIAPSVAEAEMVIDACCSAGVMLMLGETVRFRPSIAAVKLALDSRKLGDPALLRVHSWEPHRAATSGKSPAPTELFGDIIWTRAAQHLDLAQWIFRGPPTEIFVLGRNGPAEGSRGPEYVQIHLGFPHGGMALISLAESLPDGESYDSLSLVGSTGAAYADDHYQTHLLYRGGTPAALKTGEGIMAITAELREFIDAITSNRAPAVTGADGKAALQLAEAVRRSWVDRRMVRLEGGLDAIDA